jgi:hypothetical protein
MSLKNSSYNTVTFVRPLVSFKDLYPVPDPIPLRMLKIFRKNFCNSLIFFTIYWPFHPQWRVALSRTRCPPGRQWRRLMSTSNCDTYFNYFTAYRVAKIFSGGGNFCWIKLLEFIGHWSSCSSALLESDLKSHCTVAGLSQRVGWPDSWP